MKKADILICISATIGVLVTILAIGFFFLNCDDVKQQHFYIGLICGLAFVCFMFVCCGIYCHVKMSNIPTEQQIEGWIASALEKEINVKVDENVITNITELKNKLHEDLEKVFFSKNSNFIFLQNLANAIGDKESAWDEKQIKRFLECMETITAALDKNAKDTNSATLKSEQTVKK